MKAMRYGAVLFCTLLAGTSFAQWKPITTGLPFGASINMLGVHQGTVFFYTTDNQAFTNVLFRSTNIGDTWVKAESLLTTDALQSVSSLASDGTSAYLGTGGYGVFQSTNNGVTWVKKTASNFLLPAYALTYSGSRLYLGHYAVSWSTDQGGTWTQSNYTLPTSIVNKVAVKGSTVIAASSGVYRSTDGGLNWTNINGPIGSANTEDVLYMGSLLFAANSDSGVFRSTDDGTTWQLVTAGLTGEARVARRLAEGGGLIFVSTGDGIYASRDSGATWVQTGGGSFFAPPMVVVDNYIISGTFSGLARHPIFDFYAVATATSAISGPGTYAFNPTGNITGVTLNLTSSPTMGITVQRFDNPPASPLFSGTPPTGVNANRWVITSTSPATVSGELRINLSLFGSGITDPSSITVYRRAMSGSGTFEPLPTTYDAGANEIVATITGFSEFALASVPTDAGEERGLPGSFALEQNYPNPFNPTTEISFQLPVASDVRLVVCDILGREVATLVNESKAIGTHEVRFDATGLPSGTYVYRLTAGGVVQTRKMMLLK